MPLVIPSFDARLQSISACANRIVVENSRDFENLIGGLRRELVATIDGGQRLVRLLLERHDEGFGHLHVDLAICESGQANAEQVKLDRLNGLFDHFLDQG